MTKAKVTISVDRDKLDHARALVAAGTTSATIDVALTRLITLEHLRRDVAAYQAEPPTAEEVALAAIAPGWDDLADDTDWDALYSDDQ